MTLGRGLWRPVRAPVAGGHGPGHRREAQPWAGICGPFRARDGSVGRVVLLTMHKSEKIFQAALDLGVSAYLLKDEAESGIVSGIKCAARGDHYITPTLASLLVNRGRKAAQLRQQTPGLENLTPTERVVLRRIAENKTSREIGTELFISHRTVETHRANICAKLNLSGSHPLLQFALENKSALMDLAE